MAPPTVGWVLPHQSSRIAHRPVWSGHLLNCSTVIPDVPCLCQTDKKLTSTQVQKLMSDSEQFSVRGADVHILKSKVGIIHSCHILKMSTIQAVVAHIFNPCTWEAEAGGSLSSRPASSAEQVPGQPGLHRETLSGKPKQNKTNK